MEPGHRESADRPGPPDPTDDKRDGLLNRRSGDREENTALQRKKSELSGSLMNDGQKNGEVVSVDGIQSLGEG